MSSPDEERIVDPTKERYNEDFVNWSAAVELHAAGEFQEALQLYHSMHETSGRIFYNMAVAYINVGDLEMAEKCLTSAVERDEGLAIAFFQRGTLHLERQDVQSAMRDLETTRMLLRGNTFINYRPLGLFCHLDDFAILYNLALAHLMVADEDEFQATMTEATHNADHFQREQISRALRLFKQKRWTEIQPINVSTEAVFTPPKEILKVIERKRSSKRSKVVFASDKNDNTPSFRGKQRIDDLRKTMSPENRRVTDTRTSMKRKLFRKLKSTGDLHSNVNAQHKHSGYRKRYSFGSSDRERVAPFNEAIPALKDAAAGASCSNTENDIDADSRNKATHNSSYTADTNTKDDVTITNRTNKDKVNIGKASIEEIEDRNKSLVKEHDHPKPDDATVSKELENTSETISKRRFKRNTKSFGDVRDPTRNTKSLVRGKVTRSAGDIENVKTKSLLPLERDKKTRTSMTSLKHLINKHNKKLPQDVSHPTVLMQGCSSAVQLGLVTMFVSVDDDVDNITKPNNGIGEDIKDVNDTVVQSIKPLLKSNYSLGSVFGDKSTVIKYALTEACDVLTASITPTIDESELNTNNKRKKEFIKQKSKTKLNHVEKTKRSTKSKRAPEPPKSVIRPELFAAGQLMALTALAHHDFPATDNVDNVCVKAEAENETKAANTVESSVSKHNSISGTTVDAFKHNGSFKTTRTSDNDHGKTGDDLKLRVFDENLNTVEIEVSKHKDVIKSKKKKKAPKISIAEIFENGLVAPCDVTHTYNLTTTTHAHCLESKGNELQESEMPRSFAGEIKTSSRRAKLPPPAYPPPPLRPFHWKNKKKQSKRKQSKTELSGLSCIGNALLTSGRMLGAMADVSFTDDVFDEANLTAKPGASRSNTSRCETNRRSVAEGEYHDYVNVGKCKIDKSTGNVCLIKANKLDTCEIYPEKHSFHSYENVNGFYTVNVSPTENLPVEHNADVSGNSSMPTQSTRTRSGMLDKMLVEAGMLTAFVTSNQEIRQAYETFVSDKNNNVSENTLECFNNDRDVDVEHDYVNVVRL